MSVWEQLAAPGIFPRVFVFVGMAGLQSAVAVWAAVSPRHWFIRAVAVWLAVSMLIPICAWEPAWVFMASSPLTVGLLRLLRRFQRPQDAAADHLPTARWRFSLLDALLLMAVAGLSMQSCLTIVRSFQPVNWLGWLAAVVSIAGLTVAAYLCAGPPKQGLFAYILAAAMIEFFIAYWLSVPLLGALAAAIAIVAYFSAFNRRHWRAVVIATIAVPISAAAMVHGGSWMRPYLDWDYFGGRPFRPLVVIGAAFVVWLLAVTALARAATAQSVRPPWRLLAGALAAVLVLCVAVPVGRVYWMMLRRQPRWAQPAMRTVPENRFANIFSVAKDIARADSGALVYKRNSDGTGAEVWRQTPASGELQALHDELLRLLQQPCAVPYDPRADTNAGFEEWNLQTIETWRLLVHSLQAEAHLAGPMGEPDKAATIALGIVWVGDMHARGGLEINALLGISFRRVGYVEICRVRDSLTAEKLRDLLSAVRQSPSTRDPVDTIVARQAHFEEHAYGWQKLLHQALFYGGESVYSDDLLRNFSDLDLLSLSLLEVDLAIRLFKQERGHWPTDLSQLAPTYCSKVPRDHYGQTFVYEPGQDDFRLYSIGADGRDDGGRCGTINEYMTTLPRIAAPARVPGLDRPSYDFDLETLIRE